MFIKIYNFEETANLEEVSAWVATVLPEESEVSSEYKKRSEVRSIKFEEEEQIDIGILTVNANETRLAINDNGSVGYRPFYQALLQKAKYVICLIVDDRYQQPNEIISDFVRRKLRSQFSPGVFTEGTESFVVSCSTLGNPIHSQILLHGYEIAKTGKRFPFHYKEEKTSKYETSSDNISLPKNTEELKSDICGDIFPLFTNTKDITQDSISESCSATSLSISESPITQLDDNPNHISKLLSMMSMLRTSNSCDEYSIEREEKRRKEKKLKKNCKQFRIMDDCSILHRGDLSLQEQDAIAEERLSSGRYYLKIEAKTSGQKYSFHKRSSFFGN